MSLEEFVRRAADGRAVQGAPSTNPDGRSAETIRSLIEHYQAMLRVIENFASRQELSIAGIGLCLGVVCQHHESLLPLW